MVAQMVVWRAAKLENLQVAPMAESWVNDEVVKWDIDSVEEWVALKVSDMVVVTEEYPVATMVGYLAVYSADWKVYSSAVRWAVN